MQVITQSMVVGARAAISAAALMAASVVGVARAAELPEIVAHRGASHLAPENTMAAVNLAWEVGADAVECDVYLSRDGYIVLHHDATTRRTAGVNRRVADQTWDELRALDLGSWKGEQWAGEPMPLLADVLPTVPADKRLFIEIKCGPEIVEPLAALLADSGKAPDQTCVISFSREVVAAMKAARPDLKVYWLSSFRRDEETGAWTPSIDEIVAFAKAANLDGVDLRAREPLLNEEAVSQLREAGLEIHAWTVDDPDLAHKLVRLGVDGITTNRPGWLHDRLIERLGASTSSH